MKSNLFNFFFSVCRHSRMFRKRKLVTLLLRLVFILVIIIFVNNMKTHSLITEHPGTLATTFTTTEIELKSNFYVTFNTNLNPRPKRLVLEVNCQGIIKGDVSHILFASELSNRVQYRFSTDKEIGELAESCDTFLKTFDYNRFSVLQEELDFPIAFSLIAHKDAVQIEILLRAIYRPHNVYCIHVDKSSNSGLRDAMKAISKCLPNVFIASKLEDIIYEGFSRLQADLNCMLDLLNYTDVKWKYLINLPAQEYPLKTNAEIVQILRILNGTSSIESIYYKDTLYRVNQTFKVNPKTLKMEATGRRKDPAPFNITIGKGNAYGAFCRSFVHFALNDAKAQELLEWTKDTFSPDETFWATLAMNKHLAAPGIKYTTSGIPDQRLWITTSIAWNFSKEKKECKGKYVRDVCIFGIGDLQRLVSKKELFANKFYHDYQPFALMCMEEWLFNKSVNSFSSELYFYIHLMNS